MSFVIYCSECNRKITAHTMLDGSDLWSALNSDADVEVIHVSDNNGDHRWTLDKHEKDHLMGYIKASGRVL